MMEMTDAFGSKIFETIQITLVCDDCLKTGVQTPTSTNVSFTHNCVCTSLCSQITPKSASA